MLFRPLWLARHLHSGPKRLWFPDPSRLPFHPWTTLPLRRPYAVEAVHSSRTGSPPPAGPPGAATSNHDTKVISRRREPPEMRVTFTRQDLLTELHYLGDPYDLADKTKSRLQNVNPEEKIKALELVKLASGRMKCTVSWNHLINDHLLNGEVGTAINLYNDMKKRAQVPDAFTFTALFNGLARNARRHGVLEKALAIYNSMRAENAPVKPNLIHTNALLNICALKHDVDAMLGVAADLPVKGKDAPDKWTFTIILNAIRNAAEVKTNPRDPTSIRDEQKAELRGQAVLQGRRLWEEIRDRWSKLDFKMDEELVCAMGRLLMLGGTKQDYDDVFSLLDQTMTLPRMTREIPGEEDASELEQGQGAFCGGEKETSDRNDLTETATATEKTFSSISPQEEARLRDEETNPFIPVSLSPHQYVVPGNKTLSLVLDACANQRLYRTAQDYWGLLTDPEQKYNIDPDQQNYISYVRLLRFRRQSRMTLEIIKEMKANGGPPDQPADFAPLPPKLFRIALSTCVRDKKNRSALGYAEQLIAIMTETLECPDPQSLASYLKVALTHNPTDYTVAMRASHRCMAPFRTIRASVTDRFQDAARGKGLKTTVMRFEDEVLDLAANIVRTLDITLNTGKEVISAEDKRLCMSNRAWVAAWITRRNDMRKVNRERQTELREVRQREKLEAARAAEEQRKELAKEWAERNPEEALRRKWLQKRNGRGFSRRLDLSLP